MTDGSLAAARFEKFDFSCGLSERGRNRVRPQDAGGMSVEGHGDAGDIQFASAVTQLGQKPRVPSVDSVKITYRDDSASKAVSEWIGKTIVGHDIP